MDLLTIGVQPDGDQVGVVDALHMTPVVVQAGEGELGEGGNEPTWAMSPHCQHVNQTSGWPSRSYGMAAG
jgi:hypothetical protein